MKRLMGIKRLPMAVYNFFNMFHKDKGAHFAYNIGVSMMRAGLFCFLTAVILTIAYAAIDRPFMRKKDTVTAVVDYCSMEQLVRTMGRVEFTVTDSSGRSFSHEQYCTWGGCRHYKSLSESGERCRLTRYTVKGGADYITYHHPLFVRYEYYWSHPDSPMPVPIWLVPVALVLMVVFFLIGRRQIRISMKYPRLDIPDELSGAPVIYTGGTERGAAYDDPAEEACPYDELPEKRL